MIYTAYVKSDDRGISRGIHQGTRKVKEGERVFFDTTLGVAYVLSGENLENIKVMHPSNMGGDLTYFVHLLIEQETYSTLSEVIEKFSRIKEEKAVIIKKEKKKIKGA